MKKTSNEKKDFEFVKVGKMYCLVKKDLSQMDTDSMDENPKTKPGFYNKPNFVCSKR